MEYGVRGVVNAYRVSLPMLYNTVVYDLARPQPGARRSSAVLQTKRDLSIATLFAFARQPDRPVPFFP